MVSHPPSTPVAGLKRRRARNGDRSGGDRIGGGSGGDRCGRRGRHHSRRDAESPFPPPPIRDALSGVWLAAPLMARDVNGDAVALDPALLVRAVLHGGAAAAAEAARLPALPPPHALAAALLAACARECAPQDDGTRGGRARDGRARDGRARDGRRAPPFATAPTACSHCRNPHALAALTGACMGADGEVCEDALVRALEGVLGDAVSSDVAPSETALAAVDAATDAAADDDDDAAAREDAAMAMDDAARMLITPWAAWLAAQVRGAVRAALAACASAADPAASVAHAAAAAWPCILPLYAALLRAAPLLALQCAEATRNAALAATADVLLDAGGADDDAFRRSMATDAVAEALLDLAAAVRGAASGIVHTTEDAATDAVLHAPSPSLVVIGGEALWAVLSAEQRSMAIAATRTHTPPMTLSALAASLPLSPLASPLASPPRSPPRLPPLTEPLQPPSAGLLPSLTHALLPSPLWAADGTYADAYRATAGTTASADARSYTPPPLTLLPAHLLDFPDSNEPATGFVVAL